MNAVVLLLLALLAAGLAGCQEKPDVASARAELARIEAASVEASAQLGHLAGQHDALTADVERLRADERVLTAMRDGHGVHYVLRVSIRQVSYSLSLRRQLRDAVNEEEFEMPTDRATYEHTSVGQDLFDSFRMGSAIFHGSLGSWRLKVVSKRTEIDPEASH